MRPSMAPRPTSRATLASVPPKPPKSVGMMPRPGMPVATAVSRLTIISDRKACTRNRMISTSSSAMAATATSKRPGVLNVQLSSSSVIIVLR